MKISEYKNEKALEVLADLIEPSAEIFTDEELMNLIRSGKKMPAISYALKNHAKSVIKILAILDDVPYEEYECKLLTLPIKLLEIFNDEDLMVFFSSQVATLGQTFSGNATESTEESPQSEDSSSTIKPNTDEKTET